MNKYRRFKYPFGGNSYVDPSNPTPDLQTILAYQDNLPVAKNTGSVQPINNPSQYLQEYTERVRPEIERKVNEMNRRPSGNGKIIRNHDKLYDYYKDGDRLYYRKKGGKNWIDISDNDVAQKRINATIARNKRSYSKPKNSSDEYTPEEMRAQGFVQNEKGYWVRPQDLKDNKTYDAGTLNDVVVTGTRRNSSSTPRRVQGASNYNQRYSIYGDKYAPKRKNNESIYSGEDSDYLFRVINRAYRVNNDIENDVTHMQNNQVEIPEAKVKDWRYYLNHKPQPQPTGARGAIVRATPSKWRGKY